MKPLPRAYKRHIDSLVTKLRKEFFLHEYAWSVKFFDDIPGYENSLAAMDSDPRYLRFTLKISHSLLEYWENKQWWGICEVLVHEFAHTVTEPLYVFAIDAVTNMTKCHLEDTRERQTQRITNVVMSLLPKSFYTPKVAPKPKRRKHA